MYTTIWVTGTGAVTPGGWTADETWHAVVAGKSCTRTIARFPTFQAATNVGAPVPGYEVDVPDDEALSLIFGRAAALEAMAQAGLDPDAAVVDHLIVATHGERRLPRADRGTMLGAMNDVSAQLASTVGARRSSALYGACAGGVLAIGAAAELLQVHGAQVALAGGADSLLRPIDFFSFCSLYAMSSRDCPPEEASCPFDRRRDGFVLGEGAAFVVLETEAHARARGAVPLAVVEGFGSAQNAYHMVASPPDAEGPAQAMARALASAGLRPADIDYINAHGTSTRDNDWCESMAIRKVFGADADALPVSSSKSVLGHAMAPAGAIETVLCVQALQQGVVPPTINLAEPDPRCDLDYVPGTARDVPLRHVMNNSFGFGGHSASLVLGRPA